MLAPDEHPTVGAQPESPGDSALGSLRRCHLEGSWVFFSTLTSMSAVFGGSQMTNSKSMDIKSLGVPSLDVLRKNSVYRSNLLMLCPLHSSNLMCLHAKEAFQVGALLLHCVTILLLLRSSKLHLSIFIHCLST